jgi:hypothetical protein
MFERSEYSDAGKCDECRDIHYDNDTDKLLRENKRLTRELAEVTRQRDEITDAAHRQCAELARLRGLIEKACSSVLISPDLAEWLREEAAKGIK